MMPKPTSCFRTLTLPLAITTSDASRSWKKSEP
jgi:hypothetical protein